MEKMNVQEFTDLFFKVIEKFDDSATQVIRNKMLFNKKYPEQLLNRCKRYNERYCISIHDALYSILTHGEIDKVKERYLKARA